MPGLRRWAMAWAGAGLALAGISNAHAYMASEGAQSAPPPSTTYTVSRDTVQLSRIVVNGHRLIMPLYLQMVKSAIHRSWSSKWADRNKLVCRFRYEMASHFQTLTCMTNGEYFGLARQTQIAMTNGGVNYRSYKDAKGHLVNGLRTAINSGQVPMLIANYTNQQRINRGALMTLLRKLPPAGSSYVLRVTRDGKPAVDYVIDRGEVKAVHRYVYKDGGDGGHQR